jgi:NAD(P)-dependent dehydrogenase (short-subunit alcohol dehydrogenase family)
VRPADLINPKQVATIGGFIDRTLGRHDILANNAGGAAAPHSAGQRQQRGT